MVPEHKPIVDYLLTFCGVSFIGFGVIIYRANNLRSANRVFAIQMLIAGLWTMNYSYSVHPGPSTVTHLRVGAAIASFLPWVLTLVSQIVSSSSPRPVVQKRLHVIWGGISAALAVLTQLKWFIDRDPVSFSPIYGPLWGVYHGILCATMAVIAYNGFKATREIQGRRRDEMLIAVVAAAATIALVSGFLIIAGNEARVPPAEYALFVIVYAFVLTWIILVRGIYDARAIASVIFRSLLLALSTAAIFVVIDYILNHLLGIEWVLSDVLAGLTGGLVGVWLNRVSLRHENALLYQSLSDFQRRVNEVTREAVSTDIALAMLEKIIAEQADAAKALILTEVRPGRYQRGPMVLEKVPFKWQRTGRTEWITPASTDIDAAEDERGRNLDWLRDEDISLVITSPRSPQHVNVIVALGPRRQELSYTFYELECLGLMVESTAIALSTIEASAQAQHAGKMMAIGLISASVIHEVKQPLAALRLFFKMLPARFNDERFRNEYFDVIPRQLAQIEDTLSALLRLGRSENYNIQVFDPRPLVEETLTLLQPKAAASRISVLCDLPADGSMIRADPIVLKQALLNLGLNAIQAMATHNQDDHRLVITSEPCESGYELWIRDTGPGLSPQILDRLFRPFVTTKEDGIGLGLYITRDQVVKTGGVLLAANHKDGGALFRLRFPLAG